MSSDLKQATELIKENKEEAAREILLDLLKTNAANDEAWVWLASITADREERKQYLEEALKHNPRNQMAFKTLQKMSGSALVMQPKNIPVSGHILCGWPLLLVFLGGAIGGALGGTAYAANLAIYRSNLPIVVKIILNLIIGAAAFAIWFVIGLTVLHALRR